MRLLNTITLELTLFPDIDPKEVPYAILSHTWGRDEVTYDDMKDPVWARSREGFAKIEATCQMAIKQGLEYAWVDTCCIDKSSSAELSEAINSMFRWYKDAAVCYAYLGDLPSQDQPLTSAALEQCRWFKRGWTLQELIAPKDVIFFGQAWGRLGTKISLVKEIEAITGIDRRVLDCTTPLFTVPLAQRMSWAAGRQTSRVEDRAYSLLGIFDVNLSMIYGEGAKAFFRLQAEILRSGIDLSLFAWQAGASTGCRNVLASSPDDFSGCGLVTLVEDQFRFRGEIASTNKGIKINIAVQHFQQDTYILDLHCYQKVNGPQLTRIGVYLRRVLDTFFRERPGERAKVDPLSSGPSRPIFLATDLGQDVINSRVTEDKNRRIFVRFASSSPRCRVSDVSAVPEIFWEPYENYFSIKALVDFQCFVRFRVTWTEDRPYPGQGGRQHYSTMQYVLYLKLSASPQLGMSLYAETSMPRQEGFIDPFHDVERYGPLGDPFSMSVLNPAIRKHPSVSGVHGSRESGCAISAHLLPRAHHEPFTVQIELDRSYGSGPMAEYRAWAHAMGPGSPCPTISTT